MSRLFPLYLLLLIACRSDGTPTADWAYFGDAHSGDGATQDLAIQGDLGPCSANFPRTVPLKVAVIPDDGEAPYVDLIKSAKKSIRVFCYLMGTGGILTNLKAKAGAGLDVRVLMDRENTTYAKELTSAGVKVTYSDPKYTHMHAKTIIADESAAVISSGNYSKSYISKNRDYVARVEDPDDLKNLVTLFDADWTGTAPSLPCTRLLVSPINAGQRLKALIDSAKSTLYIESMQFAETTIREAVVARQKAGVEVKVLMAPASWVDANKEAASYLQQNGIQPRYLGSPGVHVKSIIVDKQRAYLGSVNLSFTSINRNREIGAIVLDSSAVQRMNTTFDTDWANGKAFY